MNAAHPRPRLARASRALFGNAREAIGTLTPGVRVVGLSKGQFSMLDLASAVLGQLGAAELMVSASKADRAEMEGVANLLDAHSVSRFRMLVDRSVISGQPEQVALIQRLFGAETIRQTRTHASFALIASSEHRITIRGSMGLKPSARLEQFDLDDDPTIYSFFDEAVDELYALAPSESEAAMRDVEHGFHAFGHPPGYGVQSFVCGDLFRRLGQPEQAEQLHPLDELDRLLLDMHGEPRISQADSELLDELLREGMPGYGE